MYNETMLPKLLILASGSADSGGSGMENLIRATKKKILVAKIVGGASNHVDGGVAKRIKKLNEEGFNISFFHLQAPWEPKTYQDLVEKTKADFVALSGWLKPVLGLDPHTTFNIHPGPLPKFGGKGMYGHHVHEAVMDAYHRGEITHSEITMHFVTENYDEGPVIFRKQVEILPDDTPDTLAKRVNEAEHKWQPVITNLIVNGEIIFGAKIPLLLPN